MRVESRYVPWPGLMDLARESIAGAARGATPELGAPSRQRDSISLGFQDLSNQDCSGPYRRRITL